MYRHYHCVWTPEYQHISWTSVRSFNAFLWQVWWCPNFDDWCLISELQLRRNCPIYLQFAHIKFTNLPLYSVFREFTISSLCPLSNVQCPEDSDTNRFNLTKWINNGDIAPLLLYKGFSMYRVYSSCLYILVDFFLYTMLT